MGDAPVMTTPFTFYGKLLVAFLAATIPVFGTTIVFCWARELPNRHGGRAKASIGWVGVGSGFVIFIVSVTSLALTQLPTRTPSGDYNFNLGTVRGNAAWILLFTVYFVGVFTCWALLSLGTLVKPSEEAQDYRRGHPLAPYPTRRAPSANRDRDQTRLAQTRPNGEVEAASVEYLPQYDAGGRPPPWTPPRNFPARHASRPDTEEVGLSDPQQSSSDPETSEPERASTRLLAVPFRRPASLFSVHDRSRPVSTSARSV